MELPKEQRSRRGEDPDPLTEIWVVNKLGALRKSPEI